MVICICGKEINAAPTIARLRCTSCKTWIDISINQTSKFQAIELPAIEPTKSHAEHWALLHRYALKSNEWNRETAILWFQAWQSRIPKANCKCLQHWRQLCKANSPDFSSADAFFIWTVDRHNEVNAKLGKPLMTHAEALALYQ
jgi:hypothetical protein